MGNSNIQRFFTGNAMAYVFWTAVLFFFGSFCFLYCLTTALPERLKDDASNGQLAKLASQVCANTQGCLAATAKVDFSDRHYHLVMNVEGSSLRALLDGNLNTLWAQEKSELPWYARMMVEDARVGELAHLSNRQQKNFGGKKTSGRRG